MAKVGIAGFVLFMLAPFVGPLAGMFSQLYSAQSAKERRWLIRTWVPMIFALLLLFMSFTQFFGHHRAGLHDLSRCFHRPAGSDRAGLHPVCQCEYLR